MQFIEKNSINVRSAVYCLKKDGSALEFLIFPMIHVGSAEFYDEISRRLESCDLIRAEDQQHEAKRIGIVYGACHMRSTMRFLMQQLDYRVAKAEWVKVFDL